MKSTRHKMTQRKSLKGFQAGKRRSPANPSSDGKRINALDPPLEFRPPQAIPPGAKDEENQKSSLSLTFP
jgi:hypothetical protein